MPSLDWNKNLWSKDYDWSGEGEEWSSDWGSSIAQWKATLFPRIGSFLPCESILEIAPGFGRWTRFLLPMSTIYRGVDLSQKCVDACQAKFASSGEDIIFSTNDGLSLAEIDGREFDLIFSFDSLVHAPFEALGSYIGQILENQFLSENGVCFIHHSNLQFLCQLHAEKGLKHDHARDRSCSFVNIRDVIEIKGGHTLVQELYPWGGNPGLDCFTLFCRRDSQRVANGYKFLVNSSDEIPWAKNIITNYCL